MKPPQTHVPKLDVEERVVKPSLFYPQALALKASSYKIYQRKKPIKSATDPSVLDHLCENFDIKPTFDKDGALKMELNNALPENDDDDPDVDLMALNGTWVPDLTLRFSPTFSDHVR